MIYILFWFLMGFLVNMFISYRFMHPTASETSEKKLTYGDIIFSLLISIGGLLNILFLLLICFIETDVGKNIIEKIDKFASKTAYKK